MLYKKGDYVRYKKYIGRIKFVYEYNKSYMVTLYNYHGFAHIERECYQYELAEFEQVMII